jgi:hypothetical protein
LIGGKKMRMVYRKNGKDEVLDIKPAPSIFGSKKSRKASFKVDLSEEVIVFHRIGDFDPSQIRYLCEQIAKRIDLLPNNLQQR